MTDRAIAETEAGVVDLTGRAFAWLGSGDTGISSETMCHYFMTGRAPARLGGWPGGNEPLDPSDLGRCLRLLEVMPEWRSRLPELATLSPAWAGLVAVWDELELLYLEELPTGNAPRCYKAMRLALGRPS